MSTILDYDRLAAEYAQNRRVHPGVLQGLVRDGAVSAGSRVLEIGCGTGNYLTALATLTRCRPWGIDPSAQMIECARAQGAGACRLARARAEDLPFPDRSFDLVFSVDVIHHVTDRARAFAEACRVLAPGGRVCTVTDSGWIIRRRAPLSVYFPETAAVDLARYPRLEDLTGLMAQAGLSEISSQTVEFTSQLTSSRPYRDKAFSALHLIPEQAFQAGLARLEQDLARGPVACVSRYVLLWGRRAFHKS